MRNFQFLRQYQKLQEGIMFDKLIDLGFASISYGAVDKDPFWNNALVNSLLVEEQLLKIEKTLHRFERNPTVYFENRPDLGALVELLKVHFYVKGWEDSYMFYSGEDIDTNRFNTVKKVESGEQLKVFLKIFDACYQKDDPQNPYGQLGDYLKVTESVWHKHHQSNRLEYFLVYKDDQPVAASTLTNLEGLGYISNVGSLREVRGQGFGRLATMYCVLVSKNNGNNQHFLITEEGHFPNEFYKRIGFKTKFTALGYSRKK